MDSQCRFLTLLGIGKKEEASVVSENVPLHRRGKLTVNGLPNVVPTKDEQRGIKG